MRIQIVNEKTSPACYISKFVATLATPHVYHVKVIYKVKSNVRTNLIRKPTHRGDHG